MFIFQSLGPEPSYRHDVMRRFYLEWEAGTYREVRTFHGFMASLAGKWKGLEAFFLGPALSFLCRLSRSGADQVSSSADLDGDRGGCCLVDGNLGLSSLSIADTCVIYAVVVEAIRRLRAWAPGGRPSGLLLSRAVPLLAV